MKPEWVFLMALGLATGAQAQTAAPSSGRLLASNCFQCHGTNGQGKDTFERLAGESVAEIVEELTEMRQENDRGEIMTVHAFGYTDAQIRALATWFSRQPRTGGGS